MGAAYRSIRPRHGREAAERMTGEPERHPEDDLARVPPGWFASLSEADKYALLKRIVLEDNRAEFRQWFKSWWWWIGWSLFVAGILGYFGLVPLLRNQVDDAVKPLVKEAHEATVRTKVQGDLASQATAESVKQLGTVQTLVAQASRALAAGQTAAEEEARRAKGSVKLDTDALATRLEALERLVGQLSRDSAASRQALEAWTRERAAQDATARAQAQRFVGNSGYTVVVAFLDQTRDIARQVIEKLAQAGFKMTPYDISAESTRMIPGTRDFPGFGMILRIPGEPRPQQNLIVYTRDAKGQADEVHALLPPQVAVGSARRMLLEDYARLFTPGPSAHFEQQKEIARSFNSTPGVIAPFSDTRQVWLYIVDAPAAR
jgi:hypothetical protein